MTIRLLLLASVVLSCVADPAPRQSPRRVDRLIQDFPPGRRVELTWSVYCTGRSRRAPPQSFEIIKEERATDAWWVETFRRKFNEPPEAPWANTEQTVTFPSSDPELEQIRYRVRLLGSRATTSNRHRTGANGLIYDVCASDGSDLWITLWSVDDNGSRPPYESEPVGAVCPKRRHYVGGKTGASGGSSDE